MSPYPEDQIPGTDKRSPLGLPLLVGDAHARKAAKIWDIVSRNVHKAHGPHRPSYLGDMSSATAILPFYWNSFPTDLTKYLKQELFDVTMANVLKLQRVLNWCRPSLVELYPLNASGDGNCLLHAISLALWGVEDTDLRLRRLLHGVMRGEYAAANEHRWRRERNHFDSSHIPGSGFRYNTREWSAEWRIVVDIASPERRVDQTMGLPYECLEEFHIFVMANILRRPIIILAADMWRDAAGHSLQPMNFSGIYLPLTWDAKDCCRYPIVLGYHQMHFSPLLCTAPMPGSDVQEKFLVPLVDCDLSQLPVHFLTEEEEPKEMQLLHEYLFHENLVLDTSVVPCAKLAAQLPREDLDVFDPYLKLAEMKYRMYSEEQHNPENAEVLKAAGLMSARSAQQLNERIANGAALKTTDTNAGKWVSEKLTCSLTGDVLNEDLYGPSPKVFNKHDPADLRETAQATFKYTGQQVFPRQAGLPCATPGCHYVTAVSTDKYCESCYKTLSSVGKEAFKQCVTKTCLNGGERRYAGMCKVCYDQSRFMNDDTPNGVPSTSSLMVDDPRYGVNELQGRGHVQPGMTTREDETEMEVDVQKSTGTHLNTNIVNAFTVGSRRCATLGCDFTGNPQNSGLCFKCYEKSETEKTLKGAGAGSSLTNLLTASPPKEIASTVGKKKCLMPECELTGHPDKSDFCSGCYKKQTDLLTKTSRSGGLTLKTKASGESGADMRPSDALVPESPNRLWAERQKQLLDQAHPTKCRIPKCEMFALPSQDGLCSQCYKKSTGGRVSPQSPSRVSRPHALRQVSDDDQGLGTFKPVLHFTVEKNMCATPGCNGVRLKLGDGDLCFTHYQDRLGRYSPATIALAPSFTAGRAQPSAPPPSVYPSQSNYHLAGPSHIKKQPVQALSTTSGGGNPGYDVCAHPKCNNPAAPPGFVACGDCLDFVEKVKGVQAAIWSVRGGEGARPKSHGLQTPPIDEDQAMRVLEPGLELESSTEIVKNLDLGVKLSSDIKDKFQFDHIQRVKCQASGGCPYKCYGNPQYGDLCSKCFDRDVVGKQVRTSIGNGNTLPLKKASHHYDLPPRSQSAVVAGAATTRSTTRSSSSRPASSKPGKVRPCASPRCQNQANPQVLEGFCNNCYPAYRESTAKPRKIGSSGRSSAFTGVPQDHRLPEMYKGDGYRTATGDSAAKCKLPTCSNFGNFQCRGYCNTCFQKSKGK